MFTYEYLLAAAVLTTPVPSNATFEDWLDPLQPALCRVAIDLEVLDEREQAILLAKAKDFAQDLEVLQRRFADLAHAPYIEESGRFPDRQIVNEFLSFNRAYRRDIVCRLALDPVHADQLRNILAETDQLYHVWNTIRDIRCEYYYITVRRQSLAELRRLIGPRAFYLANLPPHVPVWRIPEHQ